MENTICYYYENSDKIILKYPFNISLHCEALEDENYNDHYVLYRSAINDILWMPVAVLQRSWTKTHPIKEERINTNESIFDNLLFKINTKQKGIMVGVVDKYNDSKFINIIKTDSVSTTSRQMDKLSNAYNSNSIQCLIEMTMH
jgi:hypothetical protein